MFNSGMLPGHSFCNLAHDHVYRRENLWRDLFSHTELIALDAVNRNAFRQAIQNLTQTKRFGQAKPMAGKLSRVR